MANPQIQNDPIYSLPHLYISGLNISVASNTEIAIAAGQARDSNDVIDMPIGFPNLDGIIATSAPLFLNSAVNGANGLDQGSLAASSDYVIWLIGDSRNYLPVAGLISLSSNAFPLLPFGYDSYRLLGFVSTDGSTHFTSASVLNASSSKAYYVLPAVSELSGGNSTTFATVDLSGTIPADPFSIAILNATFTPAAAGDTAVLRPIGSSATTNLVTITGVAAGVAQTSQIQVIVGQSTGSKIQYKVTASGDSLNLALAGYIVTLS